MLQIFQKHVTILGINCSLFIWVYQWNLPYRRVVLLYSFKIKHLFFMKSIMCEKHCIVIEASTLQAKKQHSPCAIDTSCLSSVVTYFSTADWWINRPLSYCLHSSSTCSVLEEADPWGLGTRSFFQWTWLSLTPESPLQYQCQVISRLYCFHFFEICTYSFSYAWKSLCKTGINSFVYIC